MGISSYGYYARLNTNDAVRKTSERRASLQNGVDALPWAERMAARVELKHLDRKMGGLMKGHYHERKIELEDIACISAYEAMNGRPAIATAISKSGYDKGYDSGSWDKDKSETAHRQSDQRLEKFLAGATDDTQRAYFEALHRQGENYGAYEAAANNQSR